MNLTIKKSKIEASILAIVTNGSSGGSAISSLGGNSQAGNDFGGRVEKAQTKIKLNIRCVAECLLWIVFKLNIFTNPYTHDKTHETNKSQTPHIFRLRKEKYHRRNVPSAR